MAFLKAVTDGNRALTKSLSGSMFRVTGDAAAAARIRVTSIKNTMKNLLGNQGFRNSMGNVGDEIVEALDPRVLRTNRWSRRFIRNTCKKWVTFFLRISLMKWPVELTRQLAKI